MTELDLGLKIQSRRLLWRMGYSTRLDVPLRTPVPRQIGSRSGEFETYTDLDVLGVTVAPGFAIHKTIVDCKTTARGSTERMFWVRGLSDFFDSDEAWMVREHAVTAAARQLAGRLKISVLEPGDLERVATFHTTRLALDGPHLSVLFDNEAVDGALHAFKSLDRRLVKFLEYREFDYWVNEPFRNIQQLVAQLANVSQYLTPRDRRHFALFMDAAWLYVLAVAQAAQYVRAVHVTDIEESLAEYVFGGRAAFIEKQRLAVVLKRLAPVHLDAGDGVLPPWYGLLLELVTRHLRRPTATLGELQYAEWLSASQLAGGGGTVAEAFEGDFDPLSSKLLADVCGFLVTAAGLDPGFRERARGLLTPTQAPNGAESMTVIADAPDGVDDSPLQGTLTLGEPESRDAAPSIDNVE